MAETPAAGLAASTVDADEVRRLEAAAAAAWPPRHVEPVDGWALYLSGGGTRRTQSVQPMHAGAQPVDDKIEECERFYADRGLPCVFRLTPASEPTDLERRLEERGYERRDETRVLTAPLGRLPASGRSPRVSITERPSAAWVDRCLALSGARNAHARAHAATLQRVAERRTGPSAFACIEEGGEIASLGLAAVEDGLCFLGEIATDPERRRGGLARELVTALMAWGHSSGARDALLQVVATNEPAAALYRDLGFVDRYAYAYYARPRTGWSMD